MGNALVDAFVQTRNWPFGSAMAVGLIFVMLVVITIYVWFVNRGRHGREMNVL
jgi:spermidine/putrescine transport system permease protein